jgi:hydrogenase maturation protein HypF
MQKFSMCNDCSSEYDSVVDRRFHAQPNSCFKCGPKLYLYDNNSNLLNNQDEIKHISNLILDGAIVAIKGIGGFHIVCSATNNEAISRLRELKNRPKKPFAIMVRDINEVDRYAIADENDKNLLKSQKRPIVILEKKKSNLSVLIAPEIEFIGIMLAYTPLHIMILDYLQSPIVATSANFSGDAILYKKEDIFSKLSNVVDFVLDYDRDIINPIDDSVFRKDIAIRLGRGFAPISKKLPFTLEKKILALGGNQKNTISFGYGDTITISPHIGDIDSLDNENYLLKTVDNLKRLYDFEPDMIVCDKHPLYNTTKIAKSFNLPITTVSHHYAHYLACMFDNDFYGDSIGVVWDGSGYGDDGNIWGGEFLDINGNRKYHFQYRKLLGGDIAIKEPRRVALSILFDIFGDDAIYLNNPTIKAFLDIELRNLSKVYHMPQPLTSSVGRIFDAVASMSGIVQKLSFEGESGIKIESLYQKNSDLGYKFDIKNGIIQTDEMFRGFIDKPSITSYFHTLLDIVSTIYEIEKKPMLFCGGVFQNELLVRLIKKRFWDAMFHTTMPPNDASISVGQILFCKNI